MREDRAERKDRIIRIVDRIWKCMPVCVCVLLMAQAEDRYIYKKKIETVMWQDRNR